MKIKGTSEQDILCDVPGILLLSHGPLSEGLLKSFQLIQGTVENMTAFQLEEGDDPDAYREAFVHLYECMPEKSVFLIDVFGGTPFNEVLKYFLNKGCEIRAVCGMNLGMLLEASVMRKQKEKDFLVELEQIGRECVIDVGKKWQQQSL